MPVMEKEYCDVMLQIPDDLEMEKEYCDVMPQIPDDLEVVEYPPEVVERWDRIFDETVAQYRRGELKPMTAAEFAAKKGLRLDE